MLSEVFTALTDDRITLRRAGKLLYALQQRSASLRQPASGVPPSFPLFWERVGSTKPLRLKTLRITPTR
jgi:hypothetical protein